MAMTKKQRKALERFRFLLRQYDATIVAIDNGQQYLEELAEVLPASDDKDFNETVKSAREGLKKFAKQLEAIHIGNLDEDIAYLRCDVPIVLKGKQLTEMTRWP